MEDRYVVSMSTILMEWNYWNIISGNDTRVTIYKILEVVLGTQAKVLQSGRSKMQRGRYSQQVK